MELKSLMVFNSGIVFLKVKSLFSIPSLSSVPVLASHSGFLLLYTRRQCGRASGAGAPRWQDGIGFLVPRFILQPLLDWFGLWGVNQTFVSNLKARQLNISLSAICLFSICRLYLLILLCLVQPSLGLHHISYVASWCSNRLQARGAGVTLQEWGRMGPVLPWAWLRGLFPQRVVTPSHSSSWMQFLQNLLECALLSHKNANTRKVCICGCGF